MTVNKSNSLKKRVLIVDGHPSEASLCSSIAEEIARAEAEKGNGIKLLKLSDMQFDPDLGAGFKSGKPVEPDLKEFQDELTKCQHLVLVHPLWWGSAPAKLKGLFDRTLLPGFAFQYKKGSSLPDKLLTGRTASAIITSDTPDWYLRWIYGAGWNKVLRKQILEFCGFKVLKIKTLGPINTASSEKLESYIASARQMAA